MPIYKVMTGGVEKEFETFEKAKECSAKLRAAGVTYSILVCGLQSVGDLVERMRALPYRKPKVF